MKFENLADKLKYWDEGFFILVQCYNIFESSPTELQEKNVYNDDTIQFTSDAMKYSSEQQERQSKSS